MYSEEQVKFINADGSLLLLEAVAGSGKTHAVSGRVQRLEGEGKRVLVLCFTNSAVETITGRLRAAGSDTPVKTVSAFAVETLRERYGDGFLVGDGVELAKVVCARTPVSASQLLLLESLVSADAPLPATMKPITAEYLQRYEEEKERLGYLSFVDVIHAAVGLSGERFDEVIVDEAQDITPAMGAMLSALNTETLTYVGDSAQSIFNFSGVNPALFESFQKTGATRLTLETSYRCPSVIADYLSEVRGTSVRGFRTGGAVSRWSGDVASLAERIAGEVRLGDAVIAPTKRQLERVARRVEQERGDVRVVRGWEETMTLGERAETVSFSTVHSGKGDEWGRVFLLDVRGNRFWSPQEQEDTHAMRLFYVGASRASEDLILADTTPVEGGVDGE